MIYFKRMIFRKWNTLFFALVFILIFTAVPYGFYQSWNANLNMIDAVENIERGSYDILLRPRVSSMGAEANLKTLDESFASNIGEFSFAWDEWEKIEHDPELLTDEELEEENESPPVPRRGDGFTFEEWQELVNDPRIEIAAPIATLGFMDSIQQTVSLPIPKSPGNYRYNVQFYTTDGLNDYLLETHNQYFFEAEFNSLELEEVTFQIPVSSHLLVAVDPVLEQEMTGIDLSHLLKKTDEGSKNFIKILQRNELTTPLMVRIEVEEFELDWDSSELSGEEALTDLNDGLHGSSVIDQTYIESDLTPALKPFSGGQVRIQEDWSLVNIESNQLYVLPERFHILDPVEYKVPIYDVEPSSRYVGNLSVEKIASEEIPIYRRRNTMEYIGEPRPPLFYDNCWKF